MILNNVIIKRETIIANGRTIPLLLVFPQKRIEQDKTAAVLWIHGGGYSTGTKEMALFSRAMYFAEELGAVVCAPSYTLSGTLPYPAALEDCYSALMWLKQNCNRLGASMDRIIVGGESSGGGLCAALCMYAHDKKEVNISFQFPIYPMLSCYDTSSSKNNHCMRWNTEKNHAAWEQYLGGKEPDEYASPSLRKDYSSLPPMYSFISSQDCFFCETIEYMKNLHRAGVEATVDIYDTPCHTFDLLMPAMQYSKDAIANFKKAAQNAVLRAVPNQTLEIERKYLISLPDIEVLRSEKGCKEYQISQTYLTDRGNGSERVRKRTLDGVTEYFHTMKKRIDEIKRIEIENTITEEEYLFLLSYADPERMTIEKTRFAIPHKGHTVEIDIYPFFENEATAEVELYYSDERYEMPDYINIIKEVTADRRYLNSSLAKTFGKIPEEF